MEIPTITPDLLRQSPNGADCTFIKISEDIGLKLYYSEYIRDQSYETQKELAEKGWAPEVYGEKVEVPGPYKDFYGYFTEIVETCDPFNDAVIYDFLDILCDYEKTGEIPEENQELFLYLMEIYEETGFVFLDHHNKNWGKKNGKFIPIDYV